MKFDKALNDAQNEWYDVLDPSSTRLPKKGFVRDPIHGHIRLDPFDFFVLDLPPMQRLRGIAQLSFVDRIYPGANHTRFEHSLGVATLAYRMVTSLKEKHARDDGIRINPSDLFSVKLAGYLHDIGHLPFSHALEPLFEDYVRDDYTKSGMKRGENKPHELLGYMIITSDYFRDAIRQLNKLCRLNIDPSFVAALATGSRDIPAEKIFLREVIHGDFDCDRMDYLLRDAYYCGVPHGSVDLERMIETFRIVARKKGGLHLGVEESGLSAVEAMYFSRTTMYVSVYLHHLSRIIEGMILRCMHDCDRHRNIAPSSLIMHSDSSLLELMKARGTKLARSVVYRLIYRRFLKRLFVKRLMDIYPLSYSTPGVPVHANVVARVGPIIYKINEHFGNMNNVVEFERDCTQNVYPSSRRSDQMVFECPKLKLPSEPNSEEYFPVRLRDNTVKSLLDLSPVVRSIAQDKMAYATTILVAGIQPERYSEKARNYVIERFKADFGLDMGAEA